MSHAGLFIICTLVFAVLGGSVATLGVIPLGWAFLGCSVVCAACAFVNYLEGK